MTAARDTYFKILDMQTDLEYRDETDLSDMLLDTLDRIWKGFDARDIEAANYEMKVRNARLGSP